MELRLPALLAVATLTLACGNKSGGDAPAASAPAGSASAAKAPASAVDPKVDALARAALDCKSYDTSIDSSCPAMKAWNDAKDDFNEGKADASLVAMLADSNEKVRYLGALKLNQYGKAFKSDKTMAEAVVTAAEKEKSKFDGYELGAAVGHLLVRDTGTFDRVKAIVTKHDIPDLRRGILGNLLYNNQDYDPVYTFVQGMVKDPDKAVALAAMQSFWTGGTRKGAETCQLYFDNIDNPNDDLAAEASNALPWFGQCASKYEGLLDSLDKRVKSGAVGSSSYASSVRHVCEDAKANDKQRKRAAEISRNMAQKKEIKGWIRASALDSVMKCDPGNGGRSFVGKFKADADKSVADKAKEILGKK